MNNGFCCLDTSHFWHLDIHQYHVGHECLRQGKRLSAGACFPNDLHIRLQLEAQTQAAPHDCLIIYEQYSNHDILVYLCSSMPLSTREAEQIWYTRKRSLQLP